MRRSRVLESARVTSLIALLACGAAGDGVTGPGAANCSGTYYIRATIDGAAWCSNSGAEAFGVPLSLPGLYSITGFQVSGASAYSLSMSLYNIGAPGTYPIGVGPQVAGGSAILANTTGGWATVQNGEAGSITISTLTASRMEGTFTFTVGASTGTASGTKTVTSGQFVLQVKATGTISPLPANAGSKVIATIAGTSYTAAAVAGSLSLANGVLVVSSTNAVRGVGITLAGVTGVGTYAFSSSRSVGVSNATNTLSNTWNSTGAGSSGSVIITSITTSRMQGTFSGTIGPAPGTSTVGTLQVSGTFDVGLPNPP